MKMTSLFKAQQEEYFNNLCQMVTNMLELPEGSLASKSRKKQLQVPRMVVSVVSNMLDETHFNIIANGINRDRSLIFYYMKMHKSNLRSYPEYRKLFNEVYNKYLNIKQSKKTFIDMLHLRHHLNSFGIKNSEKEQITIRIKSGEVGVDIKVSYLDLSFQLELINLAMKDCNYKLNLI
jgi:transcription-repair coupling factor (superfamily II helicase)